MTVRSVKIRLFSGTYPSPSLAILWGNSLVMDCTLKNTSPINLRLDPATALKIRHPEAAFNLSFKDQPFANVHVYKSSFIY